jgi:hypothetical protein
VTNDPAPQAIDRRRFLQLTALAGVGALGAAGSVFAQSSGGAAPPAKPDSAAADTSKHAPAGPPPISDDAKALGAIIQRRYGQHLTPEQLDQVTREIDGRIRAGKTLRGIKLANGDEPDFTFHA